jgi:hypothetical protein
MQVELRHVCFAAARGCQQQCKPYAVVVWFDLHLAEGVWLTSGRQVLWLICCVCFALARECCNVSSSGGVV